MLGGNQIYHFFMGIIGRRGFRMCGSLILRELSSCSYNQRLLLNRRFQSDSHSEGGSSVFVKHNQDIKHNITNNGGAWQLSVLNTWQVARFSVSWWHVLKVYVLSVSGKTCLLPTNGDIFFLNLTGQICWIFSMYPSEKEPTEDI